MITDALLTILYGFIFLITAPLRLLADVSLPADISSTIAAVSANMALLNKVIPITTLVSILGIVIIVETAIFTYKGIMWVIRKIPTIN